MKILVLSDLHQQFSDGTAMAGDIQTGLLHVAPGIDPAASRSRERSRSA